MNIDITTIFSIGGFVSILISNSATYIVDVVISIVST